MSSRWIASVLAVLLLTDIGSAEESFSTRKGPWPIRNGHNYQPTERELKTLRREDVTPDEGPEIDRLYDQLVANDKRVCNRDPASKR
jgi:hypothetical protein